MATPDAAQGSEDSPGNPRAAEPELNSYGVPVPQPRRAGRTHKLELACLLSGIVSTALGITDEIVRGKLPGYLVALGMLSGSVAMVGVLVLMARRGDVRVWWIVASILGLIGFILVVSAAWPHACDSGCGY